MASPTPASLRDLYVPPSNTWSFIPPALAQDNSSSAAKEESSPPPTLASTLAADFHAADGPGKKVVRARAKQSKITAAFEQEVRRIGALARGPV